jgi:hypothetical protein
MKRRTLIGATLIFALIIAMAALGDRGAHASAAASWYWCASSHAFFPYVQSCSMGWQEVPVGTPMESLMPKSAPAVAKPAPEPATNPSHPPAIMARAKDYSGGYAYGYLHPTDACEKSKDWNDGCQSGKYDRGREEQWRKDTPNIRISTEAELRRGDGMDSWLAAYDDAYNSHTLPGMCGNGGEPQNDGCDFGSRAWPDATTAHLPPEQPVEQQPKQQAAGKLDYSKPIYTTRGAIICPLGLIGDHREDHSIQNLVDAYQSIFSRSEKVKALGCQEWQAGIRVYAQPEDKNQPDVFAFVSDTGLLPNYFSLYPDIDLTNTPN